MTIVDAKRDKIPAFVVVNRDGTANVHLILRDRTISVRNASVTKSKPTTEEQEIK